ncbi:spermidine synthase [Bradyrhizobium sp. JR6.1]
MPTTNLADGPNQRQAGFNLFLVGFLILFLELACIRWFSAKVVFLQFFTNIVLLAAFLGMSCGCLAARRTTNWLALFPGLALVTFAAVATIMVLYSNWGQFAVDVGHQASPQEVFFGTEYRNPDLAKFVVPIEAIAGLFFVLIALMFVGLGQTLGRAFDAYPNRVAGYSLNIGGSLAGIVGFSLLSFAQAPPVVWFGISCAGIVYLLYQDKALSILRLATIIIVVGFTAFYTDRSDSHDIRWSPYYAVDLNKSNGVITVNSIGHQEMMPFSERGSSYSLIHLLQQHSGGAPFKNVMIIGAGSGNDLAHALRFGVERIDAVEIDPVIQNIGIHNHPDKPYQDPRVVPHLDDGRHFLRTTERKYDLVVYALVDSLILHSGYANIRLESYLFTEQAFQDVRRVLKQDGVFVMYNYYRQGWIVQRVAEMAKQVFGCDPLVLPLPYKETLTSSEAVGFTTIIAGCNPRISTAFRDRGQFWLNSIPPENLAVNGFDKPQEKGQDKAAAQHGDWVPLAPAKLVVDNEGARQSTSDDWPFLYVSGRLIPDLTVRSMILLGVLGLGLVYLFKAEGRLATQQPDVLPRRGLHAARDKGSGADGAVVRQHLAGQLCGVLHRPAADPRRQFVCDQGAVDPPGAALCRAAGAAGGLGAGAARHVPERRHRLALRDPVRAGARPDVLRRRDLRPLVPRRSQSRSGVRIQHRGICYRRPRRIVLDPARLPLSPDRGDRLLSLVGLDAVTQGLARKGRAGRPENGTRYRRYLR